MNIKAEGIIFRSFKYSETSLIVDVFTREFGLLSFIISGVRKKKSTISAAMLQVMNIVDIVAYTKNNQNLGRITEIKNNYIHKDLLYDFIKSSIGIFIIETSRNCIKEKEPNFAVYDFIKDFLVHIDSKNQSLGLIPLLYLIHFSQHLGFYPNNNYSNKLCMFDWKEGNFVSPDNQHPFCMDADDSFYLQQLIGAPLAKVIDMNIPKMNRRSILDNLLNYYQYHVESFKPLKSYKVLEEIMKD